MHRASSLAKCRSTRAASATYAFIIQETTAALEKFLTPNGRKTPRAIVKVEPNFAARPLKSANGIAHPAVRDAEETEGRGGARRL